MPVGVGGNIQHIALYRLALVAIFSESCQRNTRENEIFKINLVRFWLQGRVGYFTEQFTVRSASAAPKNVVKVALAEARLPIAQGVIRSDQEAVGGPDTGAIGE